MYSGKQFTEALKIFHEHCIFEFAVKAGLIKNGKLAESLIEPPTTELIAAFSRAAVMQMVGTLGCH